MTNKAGGRNAFEPHLKAAWTAYRRYFWPLAGLEFCALSLPFLANRARTSLDIDSAWSGLLVLIAGMMAAPFLTATLSAQRQALRHRSPSKEPLYLWDRRVYLVLIASLPALVLTFVSTLTEVRLPQIKANVPVFILGAVTLAIAWLLGIYASLRLSLAKVMAAGEKEHALQISWTVTRARVGELVSLFIISSIPGLLVLAAIALPLCFGAGLKPLQATEIAWLPAVFVAAFSRLTITSYAMELEKKVPRP